MSTYYTLKWSTTVSAILDYRKHSSHSAPKRAIFRLEVKKISREGAQPSQTLFSGKGIPRPNTLLPSIGFGAFEASILASSALGRRPPLSTTPQIRQTFTGLVRALLDVWRSLPRTQIYTWFNYEMYNYAILTTFFHNFSWHIPHLNAINHPVRS